MNIKEPAFFVVLAGLLIAPWFLAGLNAWGWLFVLVVCTVIAFEVYSVLTSKKTISQHFWAFSRKNPKTAWKILGATTVGWFLLMWHLAVKMLN